MSCGRPVNSDIKLLLFLGEIQVLVCESRVKCLVHLRGVLKMMQDNTWVEVFRINPEFRILRLTFF